MLRINVAGLRRSRRRTKARLKARHGMRVSGASVKLVAALPRLSRKAKKRVRTPEK